jgi:hypothetical protein
MTRLHAALAVLALLTGPLLGAVPARAVTLETIDCPGRAD